MIRNSLAIQRGGTVEFIEKEIFRPPDGKGWLWPGAGFVVGGRLHLFFNQFEEAGRADVWNFRYVRTLLALCDDLDALIFRYVEVPNGNWGVAACVDEGVAWIFGVRDGARGRSWQVARVEAGRAADFDAWKVGTEELFFGAGAEGSVSRHGRDFVAVYTENGLSPRVMMRVAPSPSGPWGEARVVFECPEAAWDPSYLCYAAKGHPELSGPEDIVMTYAVNSTDFGKMARDRRIYRPRFVRVRR
jgi:hypothetical protein